MFDAILLEQGTESPQDVTLDLNAQSLAKPAHQPVRAAGLLDVERNISAAIEPNAIRELVAEIVTDWAGNADTERSERIRRARELLKLNWGASTLEEVGLNEEEMRIVEAKCRPARLAIERFHLRAAERGAVADRGTAADHLAELIRNRKAEQVDVEAKPEEDRSTVLERSMHGMAVELEAERARAATAERSAHSMTAELEAERMRRAAAEGRVISVAGKLAAEQARKAAVELAAEQSARSVAAELAAERARTAAAERSAHSAAAEAAAERTRNAVLQRRVLRLEALRMELYHTRETLWEANAENEFWVADATKRSCVRREARSVAALAAASSNGAEPAFESIQALG